MAGKGKGPARAGWILLAIALALAPGACVTGRVIVVEDPAGDDHGPGSYRYPNHPAFPSGSFDLRQVAYWREAKDWVIEVEFATVLESTLVYVTHDDRRELFPQTVDVYFYFGGAEGLHQEALPGRNVVFAEGNGWQRAVVLSPVPLLLREALSKTTQLSEDVFVPPRVKVSGRRMTVRVPVLFLGDEPPSSIAVLVTGTKFSRSFEVVDRIRGTMVPEGLCMPVESAAGECRLDDPQGMGCHFSGCDPCGSHPQVIDLLAAPEMQERWLKNYNPDNGALAPIKMVPVGGP